MIRTAGKSWRGEERRMATESMEQVNTVIGQTRIRNGHTQKLNGLNKLVILRQVDNDDSLDVTPVCSVGHDTRTSKEDGDAEHDT